MSIDVPGVLSLIGGTPIRKSLDVFANKLKVAKTLDGGSGLDDFGNNSSLASLLTGLINGGSMSSLLQNPIAAISGLLQTNLANGAANITAALGSPASGLVTAMTGGGGAAAAVTSVSGLAATLSGVTAGTPGPLDLINHSSLLEQFGNSVPTVISFANASAPINNSAAMATINSQIVNMTMAVIAGTMSIASATALVVSLTAQINGWVTASNLAFSTMQGALINLAALNALAASTVGGSPELQAVVASIAQPVTLATLTESAAAMSAEVDAIDANAMANRDFFQSQGFLDAIQEGTDR